MRVAFVEPVSVTSPVGTDREAVAVPVTDASTDDKSARLNVE